MTLETKEKDKKLFTGLKPASEEFLEAFSAGIGTICTECEFCGRTHFVSSERDYSEGELEKLREKAKEKPELYEEHDDFDSLSLCRIDGKHYVWGCSCNWPRRFEDFIWNYRENIAKYLVKRSKDQIKCLLDRDRDILNDKHLGDDHGENSRQALPGLRKRG